METSILKGGGLAVRIEGLDSLLKFLKEADPKLNKAIKRALKKAAQDTVLKSAKQKATHIADDGTYANSLSVASRRAGSSYVLKATDPAAGVKEYAQEGATYHPRANDKRRNARSMTSFPVGVPHRASPPRVMIPAVEENIEIIKNRIDTDMAKVLEGFHG